MEIYQAAVSAAKTNNKWMKHPNSKRKGQDITLIFSNILYSLSSLYSFLNHES